MTDTNNDKGYRAPTDVRQKDFPVDESNLVYENRDYALAVSRADDKKNQTLGMRWNGTGIGFPNSRAHPVWMMIPGEFALPILCSLLNSHNYDKSIDINKVKKAIEKILSN